MLVFIAMAVDVPVGVLVLGLVPTVLCICTRIYSRIEI